jgi:hypothetical protein
MSIQRRRVFYDEFKGHVRFWDWAKVTTTLGTMVEPFAPGNRHSLNQDFANFDPDDEINLISSVRAMPIDRQEIILSGGDGALHGGDQMPVTGR